MLQVGITGGIGSGKSTVCRIFETLGIPIYYADDRAKRLMTEDPALRKQIAILFGEEAYYEDGVPNRQHIARIAFANPDKLQQLNAAVHPAVARDSEAWHAHQQDVPYTLKEAALLYESGGVDALDRVIVVTAPESIRLQRVMQRDQVSAEAVQARMDKQWPQKQKADKSDFLIINDGQHSLIEQVLTIHQNLRQQADETGI